jgi:hypothetical protein
MPGGSKMLNDVLVKNTSKDSGIGKAARAYGKWKDGTVIKNALGSVFGESKKTVKPKTNVNKTAVKKK